MGHGGDTRGRMKISSSDGGGLGFVGRLAVTLLLVAAILTVAGLFLARTEGAKALVEDRLAKILGMDVAIDSMAIGWPYALVMRDVQSDGFSESAPGFIAQEIRVAFGVRTLWRVVVHRGTLQLARTSDGVWAPAFFARMGDLPRGGLPEVSALTQPLRDRFALKLSGGRIHWLNAEGRPTTSAGGIIFQMSPARLAGRRAHFYSLSVYKVLPGDGAASLLDVKWEWLATEQRPCIVISNSEGGSKDTGREVISFAGEGNEQEVKDGDR